MSTVELVTLQEADLGRTRMFCALSPTYKQGYHAKVEWLRGQLGDGMRYTILQVNGNKAGLIEYLPIEHAWRGVEGKGYLFIHCFWVVGRNRKHGYGRRLLEACLADAAGTNGVVVMSSRTHWLPTRKIFLKNGFETVDELPPFELLVKRLRPEAPLPHFKRAAHDIPSGLTLYHSDQCPYMQNMPLIVEKVGKQLNLPVNLIHLKTAAQAQASPCPYGILGIFYNGELLDYRPTGEAKLLELVRTKMQPAPGESAILKARLP